MPVRRVIWESLAWSFALSPLSSANPEEMMIAARTPGRSRDNRPGR
jgi:hypothetical protein